MRVIKNQDNLTMFHGVTIYWQVNYCTDLLIGGLETLRVRDIKVLIRGPETLHVRDIKVLIRGLETLRVRDIKVLIRGLETLRVRDR